jgi:hypothetical protein
MFGKKKPQEPDDSDSDGEYPEQEEEQPEPRRRAAPVEERSAKKIDKEEVGALLRYHQARAMELAELYVRLS